MTINKNSNLDLSSIDTISELEFLDHSNGIRIEPIQVNQALANLKNQGLNHLSTIIGFHDEDDIVMLYPLSNQDPNLKLANTFFVETRLPTSNPTIETVINHYPGATVYEREIRELLGVDFQNNGNYRNLLLPDGFPEDVHPLKKDYTTKELKQILDEKGVGLEDPDPLKTKSDYSISVGPQHPTHKEPIRFQFFIKGEEIEDVSLRLGFNHRGIEKALEAGDWTKNLYLIERICGICSAAHQLAYTITAEKIAGINDEVPNRAKWLRVLVAELERIHSHMLWYGVLAHDGGYDMMFHISWRDREMVMDLLEKFTGNRVNYSIQTLGGVRRDLSDDLNKEMVTTLKLLRTKVEEHKEIMEKEKTFVARMSNVGYLSKKEAIEMNAVGPTARGSGVDFDLRKHLPYAAYDEIPFDVYTRSEGDVYSSLQVRLDETLESINMCLYVLENLPSGDLKTRVGSRLPEGQAHTRVEAPRGEDIHYIKSNDRSKAPDRHKIRAPTLANITSLLHRFKRMQVADIPMIIRLIDPCIGCMERVTFVDVDTAKYTTITGEELINKANKRYRDNKEIKLFR